MEMQQWLPFVLLSSYKIFRTAVNSITVPRSSCKVFRYLSPILTKSGVSRQILVKAPISNFTKIRQVEAALVHADKQTERDT